MLGADWTPPGYNLWHPVEGCWPQRGRSGSIPMVIGRNFEDWLQAILRSCPSTIPPSAELAGATYNLCYDVVLQTEGKVVSNRPTVQGKIVPRDKPGGAGRLR